MDVVARVPRCSEHGRCVRSELYDAYCCAACDRWVEERCSDPECFYCPSRPERPSMEPLP